MTTKEKQALELFGFPGGPALRSIRFRTKEEQALEFFGLPADTQATGKGTTITPPVILPADMCGTFKAWKGMSK